MTPLQRALLLAKVGSPRIDLTHDCLGRMERCSKGAIDPLGQPLAQPNLVAEV